MKTAIQELIEDLRIQMQKAQEQDSPNIASGFYHAIVRAEAKLPKEREQIEQEAVEFAEWLNENFVYVHNGLYRHVATLQDYTITQIYRNFKQRNNG